MKDHLLGKLRRNTPEHTIRRFVLANLAAHFDVGIDASRILKRDLRVRIFDLFRSLDDGPVAISLDRACLFVEFGAHVLLDLVVLARGNSDRVFHRIHYDLRIDPFFPA